MLQVLVAYEIGEDFMDVATDLSQWVLSAQWTLGQQQASSEALPPDGRAEIVLYNGGRNFSPDAPIALVQELQPGNRLRIVYDGETVWQGWLQRLSLSAAQYGRPTATLYASQGRFILDQLRVDFPPQANIRADEIIERVLAQRVVAPGLQNAFVLDAFEWSRLDDTATVYDPAQQLDSSPGQERFASVGENFLGDVRAWEAIAEAVESEQGYFWQGRDGRFVFRDRHYFLINRSPSAEVDLDSAAVDASYRYGDPRLNEVSVTCQPRSIDPAPSVLWRSQEPISVKALSERVVIVHIDGYRSAAQSLEIPQRDVDFSAQDALGNTRSSAINISAFLISGGMARLTIRNSYPMPLDVSITLRGVALNFYDALTVTARDGVAQQISATQRRRLNLPLLSRADEAEALAHWLLKRHQAPTNAIEKISLRGDSPATAERLRTWQIGTVLRLSAYQLGHSGDYRIVGEAWRAAAATGTEATFILAPLDSTPYLQLDSSPLDLGVTAY